MNRIILVSFLLFCFKAYPAPDLDSLRKAGEAYLDSADYQKALFIFTTGIKEAQIQKAAENEAMFLVDLGYVYQYQGDLEKATDLYKKGRALAESHHLYNIIGSSMRNMATIRIQKGEYLIASEYLAEAAQMFGRMNNNDDLSSTLNTMGTVQAQLGNYKHALYFYKKALPLFEQLKKNPEAQARQQDIELDIAIVLNNIGETFKQAERYDSALFYLMKSLALKRHLHLPVYEANTLTMIGEVYHARKRYQEALRYYSDAYKLRKNNRDYIGIANSANSLGALYSDLGKYVLADKFLATARVIAEKDSLRAEQLRNYQASRLVYRQLNQASLALLFDEKYIALYEQIKNEEQFRTINDLHVKYQTEQKDKDLRKLGQENQLLIELHESKLRFIYVISLSSAIIIASVLFAYHQKRRSKVRIELMMRELNHRAKNNFQQISGMLILYYNQLKDPSVKKAIKETADRVQAMSVVHRKLYMSKQITMVRIDTFISELTSELLLSYGYTAHTLDLRMDLDEISVPADKAVPLSLIINELLTNAFKYAFQHNPQPVLDIMMKKREKKVELIVKDNGPGIDEELVSGGSFGLKLVGMLCRQIRAEYEIAGNGGTSIKIIMPQASW